MCGKDFAETMDKVMDKAYRVEVTRTRKMYAMYGGKGNTNWNCGCEEIMEFVTHDSPEQFGFDKWPWAHLQHSDGSVEFRRTIRSLPNWAVGVERESVYSVVFREAGACCKAAAKGPEDVDFAAIMAADEWLPHTRMTLGCHVNAARYA